MVYIIFLLLKKYFLILLKNEIIYLKFKFDNILSVLMRVLILLFIFFLVLILIYIIRKRNFWLIYFILV